MCRHWMRKLVVQTMLIKLRREAPNQQDEPTMRAFWWREQATPLAVSVSMNRSNVVALYTLFKRNARTENDINANKYK